MPLQLRNKIATITETVTVEDAEPLAAWLRTTPGARVNLRDCTHLHTAAFQVLLAAKIKVSAPPTDSFLRLWIMPLLERAPTLS